MFVPVDWQFTCVMSFKGNNEWKHTSLKSSFGSFTWIIRSCHTGADEMENALMGKIFSGYNLKVRPARVPEDRVVVRVGMILSSFVGLVQ